MSYNHAKIHTISKKNMQRENLEIPGLQQRLGPFQDHPHTTQKGVSLEFDSSPLDMMEIT